MKRNASTSSTPLVTHQAVSDLAREPSRATMPYEPDDDERAHLQALRAALARLSARGYRVTSASYRDGQITNVFQVVSAAGRRCTLAGALSAIDRGAL